MDTVGSFQNTCVNCKSSSADFDNLLTPGLQERYRAAIPNVTYPGTECGYPRSDAFVMLRDPVKGDIPWPGFILGQFPSSTWYWCADQMMVQRVLSAKSLSHAQGALVLAGEGQNFSFLQPISTC